MCIRDRVIDVGTTRVPDATKKSGFKLTGDVKFDEVAPKCSYITPVPGGVGPVSYTHLLSQFGVFFDFNSLALVVCKMPVEGVHFMCSQYIYEFFDIIYSCLLYTSRCV